MYLLDTNLLLELVLLHRLPKYSTMIPDIMFI